MSSLEQLASARERSGPARIAGLRDAAEAIGEEIRSTPVRSARHIIVDRLVVATRAVIPDAHLISPLVALSRRALLLVTADDRRILIDPSDAGPCSPYEERMASRHPVAMRALAALRGDDVEWPDVDLVVTTSLVHRSLVRSRARLAKNRWLAPYEEIEAAREPTTFDLPRYARAQVELEPVDGSTMIAPGVAMLDTPGPSAGHASIAFSLGGKVYVHTHAGAVVDAWSPYESSIPGLREAVRLRGVEAVIRGDASDPIAALETMAIERALADRRGDEPALFRVLPGMEIVPVPFMPLLRPRASTIEP